MCGVFNYGQKHNNYVAADTIGYQIIRLCRGAVFQPMKTYQYYSTLNISIVYRMQFGIDASNYSALAILQ